MTLLRYANFIIGDLLQEKVEVTNFDLDLINEKEILLIKNISSSPMVFATKVLMRIFDLNELYGHNVSGRTFSRNVKSKKALDEKRIKYIRWLVENHFETRDKENQWKLCRTAINKIILISEKKAIKNNQLGSNNTWVIKISLYLREQNKI